MWCSLVQLNTIKCSWQLTWYMNSVHRCQFSLHVLLYICRVRLCLVWLSTSAQHCKDLTQTNNGSYWRLNSSNTRSKDATPMHPRAPPEALFSSLNGSEPCLIYSEKSTNLEDLLQQVLWLLIGSISGKFGCHLNNINAYWANPEECCSVHCPAEGPLPSESVVDVLDLQQCLGGWLSS